MAAVLLTCTLLVIAWGVFAFGAVYPWAYTPLLIGCVVTGALQLWSRRGEPHPNRACAAGVAIVGLATLVQVVPIPSRTLAVVSPATDEFLREYDLAYSFSPENLSTHSLSINATATLRAIAFLGALSVLMLGTVRVASAYGPWPIVAGVISIGLLVALMGIVQQANFTGKIYGFWQPLFGKSPFGPFVNPNHFAGWMLMAVPLGLGSLSGLVADGMHDVKPGWRHRLLWFSSAEANTTVLVGASLLVMGLSLVLTLSRSGIAAFGAALVLAAIVVMRRQRRSVRGRVLFGYLLCLGLLSVGLTGVEAVVTHFAAVPGSQLGGRISVWRDTLAVARDFWLTGSGLNTFGTAMLLYQSHSPNEHYREAHNDYLQLTAEGGLLVGIPIVILIVLFVREVRRRFRDQKDDSRTYWIRVGAVTGLVAVACQDLVEFSLQLPGNAVLFCVLAAIAVHPCRLRASSRSTASTST
ncbi:MAG TPA: O-antigen ligase family protein [Vicinamibacterales bacterium]